MPLFYLRLISTKSGAVNGGSSLKGREGMIAVYGVQHKLIVPRDDVSGLPTGGTLHRPFIVTKKIDRSSPLLAQALVAHETFKEVTIRFYASAAPGVPETPIYVITLLDASITEITLDTQNSPNEVPKGEAYEQLSFLYKLIRWSWIKGGINSEATHPSG